MVCEGGCTGRSRRGLVFRRWRCSVGDGTNCAAAATSAAWVRWHVEPRVHRLKRPAVRCDSARALADRDVYGDDRVAGYPERAVVLAHEEAHADIDTIDICSSRQSLPPLFRRFGIARQLLHRTAGRRRGGRRLWRRRLVAHPWQGGPDVLGPGRRVELCRLGGRRTNGGASSEPPVPAPARRKLASPWAWVGVMGALSPINSTCRTAAHRLAHTEHSRRHRRRMRWTSACLRSASPWSYEACSRCSPLAGTLRHNVVMQPGTRLAALRHRVASTRWRDRDSVLTPIWNVPFGLRHRW